jgi:hypothetical protein
MAMMIGQAVGRPRYRMISDDGRAVIGCLVISDKTYEEFRIEDEVGDADIDAWLMTEMRRNAKTESQRDEVGDREPKVTLVSGIEFLELSSEPGADV